MSKRSDSEDDGTPDSEAEKWRLVVQDHYDPESDDLATTVVYALAEARDVPAIELKSPPLYSVVDIPGIESAFFSGVDDLESRKGTGSIEFRYNGHLVKIQSDGWVEVYEQAGVESTAS